MLEKAGNIEKNPIFHVKIFIPMYNELPLEKAQDWADRYYGAARHTSGQRRNAIRTQTDFREKMAKPILEATHGLISPNFISRSGLNAENIANKMKSNLLDKRTANKYLKALDRTFRKVDGITAKKIKEKLPLGAADYTLKMTFGAWRMLGPLKESGAPPIMLAENFLTGEQNTANLLRDKDEVIAGRPILITDPKNRGRFKKELHNQLMRSFKNIYELGYSPGSINRENDIINRLINNFLGEGFDLFNTGGESHLDFVLVPESVIPSDSPVIRDIQYKIYRHFLGEKTADMLRSNWTETVRAAPIDPKFYIDNPDKFGYFDMYLDVQITKR
ncbi:MAG: hypothetical protein AB1599_07435 [Planctomycetota bacterium]